MARSVRFDCQRLEVFGHAVQAVAVIDELAEELPEGRGLGRTQVRGRASAPHRADQPRHHPDPDERVGDGQGHGQGRSPGARPLRGLPATGS